MTQDITSTITVPSAAQFAPPIDSTSSVAGVSFRAFQGAKDYANILAIINGSKTYDKVERSDSLESVTHFYNHLHNCDPFQDLLFAEVDGKAIGYIRAWWSEEKDGAWLGEHFGFLLPEWRKTGAAKHLLDFAENRLRQIAAEQLQAGQLDADKPRQFAAMSYLTEADKIALLEEAGYQAVRHEHVMVRPNLEDIPEASLPPGLEVRPVLSEHYRKIWEADMEAFQDHWGYVPPDENDYLGWIEDPQFDPSLFQVAWEGDLVAGMVLAFINHQENEEYRRKRGWTEGVSVRRPWRRRGLARALLVCALHAVKQAGMTEAALSVDTQNLNSAFHLYESVGFQRVGGYSFYRKPMEG